MGSRSRKGYSYQNSEDDDETSEDSEYSDDDGLTEQDEALIQSAMVRIRRAHAKGKGEVKLTKGELAALDKRRKLMEAQKKPKPQRLAVPLSQLDLGLGPVPARKSRSIASEENLSRYGGPDSSSERQVYPPMGHFPPPKQGNRRRSATSTSQMMAMAPNSPTQLTYSYVNPSQRQLSDTSSRTASRPVSRAPSARNSHYDEWTPTSSQSSSASSIRPPVDPFQFQTGGLPRASYMPGQGSGPVIRRQGSGPQQQVRPSSIVEAPGILRAGRPVHHTKADEEFSEEETSEDEESGGEEGSSDNSPNQGVQVNDRRHSDCHSIVVEEDSPSSSSPPRGRRPPSPTPSHTSNRRAPVTRAKAQQAAVAAATAAKEASTTRSKSGRKKKRRSS